MPRRFTVAAAALLFCLAATPSGAFNELEVVLVKRSDGAGGFLYDIGFSGNKDGATTCELTTPKSATPMVCPKVGDEFELVWTDLAFADVETETAQSWTLLLDKDLTTETMATIAFGFTVGDPLTESSWAPVPMITNPLNGAIDVSPNTTIDWVSDFFTDDGIEFDLIGPSGTGLGCVEEVSEGDLPASARSCTPLSPLEPGEWTFTVDNFKDIRLVPDGITITGDDWVLENEDWLALDSIDSSSFTVIPEPSTLFFVTVGLVTVALRPRRRV